MGVSSVAHAMRVRAAVHQLQLRGDDNMEAPTPSPTPAPTPTQPPRKQQQQQQQQQPPPTTIRHTRKAVEHQAEAASSASGGSKFEVHHRRVTASKRKHTAVAPSSTQTGAQDAWLGARRRPVDMWSDITTSCAWPLCAPPCHVFGVQHLQLSSLAPNRPAARQHTHDDDSGAHGMAPME